MKTTVWQDVVRMYSLVLSMELNRKLKVTLNFTTSSYLNYFAGPIFHTMMSL